MGRSLGVARRFAENLRQIRKEAGLSQEELGFRAGLHRTEVGLLERGARVPRLDTLVKLAAALGVRIECPLFEGISWEMGTAARAAGAFALSGPDVGPTEASAERSDA